MTLLPSNAELVARARADLRLGLPVLLRTQDGSALVMAAETISPERLSAMRSAGSELTLAITVRRAETLKARAYDGDLARIVVPGEVGPEWIGAVSDPADDLRHPMKGPFMVARGGDAEIHRAGIRLAKTARLLPAVLVQILPPDAAEPTILTALEASSVPAQPDPALTEIVAAHVPLSLARNSRLHIFRPGDGAEEHYAIEVGAPDRSAPVLARLHSACFTGDLLGSLKCDCGPQLRAAISQMGDEGAGVLLYLNQEGRGIGLANKMRAYSLQDQGFDTVEANHRLGFEDDERDFRLGAEILRRMGFRQARLMTNNPAKVDMLRECGITVTDRVPLKVGATPENADYLATKAKKSGHLL